MRKIAPIIPVINIKILAVSIVYILLLPFFSQEVFSACIVNEGPLNDCMPPLTQNQCSCAICYKTWAIGKCNYLGDPNGELMRFEGYVYPSSDCCEQTGSCSLCSSSDDTTHSTCKPDLVGMKYIPVPGIRSNNVTFRLYYENINEKHGDFQDEDASPDFWSGGVDTGSCQSTRYADGVVIDPDNGKNVFRDTVCKATASGDFTWIHRWWMTDQRKDICTKDLPFTIVEPPPLECPASRSGTAVVRSDKSDPGFGNYNIYLNWSTVSGASEYRLYRKIAPATDFTMLTTITDTSFIDTKDDTHGFPQKTTITYNVRPYNSVTEEKDECYIPVDTPTCPTCPCVRPTIVTTKMTEIVSPPKFQNTLTWTGDPLATDYSIYRCITSQHPVCTNFYEKMGTTGKPGTVTAQSFTDKNKNYNPAIPGFSSGYDINDTINYEIRPVANNCCACQCPTGTPTPTPSQCQVAGGACGFNLATCISEGGTSLGKLGCPGVQVCCDMP